MIAGRGLVAALHALETGTLAIGILALAAVTIANVFARSLTGWSLAWAEEVSSFLVLWITFLGVADAARRGRHIRMTALTDALAPATRRRLDVAIAVLTGALCLVLAWIATGYVARVRTWGAVSPALRVPLWLVYVAAPLGLLAAAGEYATIALRGGVHDDEPPAAEEPTP